MFFLLSVHFQQVVIQEVYLKEIFLDTVSMILREKKCSWFVFTVFLNFLICAILKNTCIGHLQTFFKKKERKKRLFYHISDLTWVLKILRKTLM